MKLSSQDGVLSLQLGGVALLSRAVPLAAQRMATGPGCSVVRVQADQLTKQNKATTFRTPPVPVSKRNSIEIRNGVYKEIKTLIRIPGPDEPPIYAPAMKYVAAEC